jgi:hypothetical protein
MEDGELQGRGEKGRELRKESLSYFPVRGRNFEKIGMKFPKSFQIFE